MFQNIYNVYLKMTMYNLYFAPFLHSETGFPQPDPGVSYGCEWNGLTSISVLKQQEKHLKPVLALEGGCVMGG